MSFWSGKKSSKSLEVKKFSQLIGLAWSFAVKNNAIFLDVFVYLRGFLSLVPNWHWWHVQGKEWKTENKNGTSTEALPKSLEFSSMWFIFILVVLKLVPYSTSICTICQRRLLKALSHRNPKKEEMKLNRMKIKLAALWNVCLERKLTRGLMFLNSWER